MVTARQLQENRVKLGMRIRMLRKSQGYSQEAFGHTCGLDRTYIGGVERGEYNIALDNIYKIATALQVGIRELFVEEVTR